MQFLNKVSGMTAATFAGSSSSCHLRPEKNGMKSPALSVRIAIAAALAVGAIQRSASAGTTYTIKRIGVPSSATGTDAVSGSTLDTNAYVYADNSGNVVGDATLYGGSAAYNSTAMWFYNGNISITLGFVNPTDNTVNDTTNVFYKRANDTTGTHGGSLGANNYWDLFGITLGNSRDYNHGYVVGASRRFDSYGRSLGADAWVFNGNGATASTKSVAIPIPSTVVVPTSSAQLASLSSLGLSGSANGTYSAANGGNLAYNVPSQNTPDASGTLETMGNSTSSPALQVGATGHVAGLVSLYYNTTGTTWAQTATDAFYFDGTTSKLIGLVNGNDVSTSGTGSNKFARASTITRLNDSDKVLGYSTYYGDSTNTAGSAKGNDEWLYDPANATGTGANGTQLIAPPSSLASSGNVYALGTSFNPNYLTNSGIVSSVFQQYASTDTARGTALSQDTFLYNSSLPASNPAAWTKVGLTGSAYTFSSAGNQTGVGGSSFANVSYSYAPPVNEAGQAMGQTKRTGTTSASANITLGQDAWVYYPTTNVPSGAVSGTTQIGLIGGAYETTVASTSSVTRSSTPAALTAAGAVIGTSTRYYNTTSTNSSNSPASGSSPGADAWIYDPAHGITTTTAIGLFSSTATPDPVHEYTVTGLPNIGRSSTITAIGSNGMVGGVSNRYSSANYSVATGTGAPASTGVDAWVYDPITKTTYNVDPNSPTDRTKGFASTISYISSSGVALGYDSNTLTNTGSPVYNYTLFDWYLAYDSGDSLNDIPTFQYLYSAVDPASLSAGDWSALFTSPGSSNSAPSMTADGKIIGLGDISDDSSNSYIPFQLTPSSVPEPASLALLLPGAAMLMTRRKRASR